MTEELRNIRKLAIIGIVSDDDLLEHLVLKGGNALALAYNKDDRASVDIDFSMESEFNPKEHSLIEEKIRKSLSQTFRENDYHCFDVKFFEKPRTSENNPLKSFWGGYFISFKVISDSLFEKIKSSSGPEKTEEHIRKQALKLGKHGRTPFEIEISKFEYCKGKNSIDIDGYAVYAYTPEMIVCEKIRAICQQLPDYKKIIASQTRRPRPRDFFDIFTLIDQEEIDLGLSDNLEILRQMFKVKKVPLDFLKQIKSSMEFHEQDFHTLKETVNTGVELKNFAFYFDFVCRIVAQISEPLGIK